MLKAFNALGYADVAPQEILAHEFGHQVQIQLGIPTNVRIPEATRKVELMADAFSAYFLTHSRGLSMNWKRVNQFLQVFFNIGDCKVTIPAMKKCCWRDALQKVVRNTDGAKKLQAPNDRSMHLSFRPGFLSNCLKNALYKPEGTILYPGIHQ